MLRDLSYSSRLRERDRAYNEIGLASARDLPPPLSVDCDGSLLLRVGKTQIRLGYQISCDFHDSVLRFERRDKSSGDLEVGVGLEGS